MYNQMGGGDQGGLINDCFLQMSCKATWAEVVGCGLLKREQVEILRENGICMDRGE